MFKRIKLYWKNLKESQTMKEALFAKVVGILVMMEPYLPIFEESIPPQVYGVILISFGLLAKYRRGQTTTPLSSE